MCLVISDKLTYICVMSSLVLRYPYCAHISIQLENWCVVLNIWLIISSRQTIAIIMIDLSHFCTRNSTETESFSMSNSDSNTFCNSSDLLHCLNPYNLVISENIRK